MKDPDLRSKKLVPVKPKHAYTDSDMERLKNHVQTWNPKLEDGFPCQHRRQKRFFTEEGVTWLKLQEGYEKAMKLLGSRVMKYSRWLQYVHFLYPKISLV